MHHKRNLELFRVLQRSRVRRCGLAQNGLPIDDRVPDQPVVAPIQVAMKRIEIKRHHVPFSRFHIQYRWTADQTRFAPDLPTH